MVQPLKVIMMGGRRCGKTSALASLFEQMKNGPVKEYFTVADRTVLETKGFEIQDSLNDKTLELQNMLEVNKENSNIFLVDKKPTSNFWLYKLHLQIPGTHREMDIEFRDSAGEFFESSSTHSHETEEYIKDCDVFVIVIDTPYLMGSKDETTKDICPESINLGTNRVNDIQNFLTHINDREGKDAKMVVFVPLKCEKWAKEPNGLNNVTARIKEVYATHIKNLMALGKANISIIPMQTSGNIIFSEFRKAYHYKDNEVMENDGKIRCCMIDDEIIRKENGDHDTIDNKNIKPDPEAVINGTNLLRPYSWYQINPKDNSFSPKNCDQLPLHIIRFMLMKLMDAESAVTHKGLLGSIYDFFRDTIIVIRKRLGGIDPEELKTIIGKMQHEGIIKDNGDGIEIIKRF